MQHSTSPRRQFERYHIKTNAIVHCRGRFQCAKVIDYSVGGLQLEGTFGLIKTDAIQIEFISGCRVYGRVAWSLGTQTGIVFSKPLPTGHPALIELARRTNTRYIGLPYSQTCRFGQVRPQTAAVSWSSGSRGQVLYGTT